MKADQAGRLKALIAEHYRIGELVDYEQLLLGYCNVSYVIETVVDGKRGKRFLRRYRQGIKAEEVEFEHSVINHLVTKGFELVARVIPTANGRTFVEQAEDGGTGQAVFYALFEFLPGEDRYSWVDPKCDKGELACAARVLAEFHGAVFDLSPAGRRYEPRIPDLLPQIARNVEMCAAKAGATAFDIYLLENRDFVLDSICRTLRAIGERETDELVQQVIHCDYHPGNLKFQHEIITGLFDFDWSKVDARCFDVALALFYFCTAWEGERAGELRLDDVATFLHAYQDALRGTHQAGPLNDAELALLPDLIGASNLYVLNWTIVDWANKELDPQEYLVYLRHGVRVARWLQDGGNRAELERIIAESAGLP